MGARMTCTRYGSPGTGGRIMWNTQGVCGNASGITTSRAGQR